MKNQECKVRPKIINSALYYSFSIKVNKCSRNCNSINDPYFKECVPDIIKYINLKVFDMISFINETKQIKWHESCKCECKLNASVCNNKQKWNKHKCRCECIKLDRCSEEFSWNPINCICGFKKKIANLLVDDCKENINEDDMVENKTKSVPRCNKSQFVKIVNHSLLYLFYVLLETLLISGVFVHYYFNSQSKRKIQDIYKVFYY